MVTLAVLGRVFRLHDFEELFQFYNSVFLLVFGISSPQFFLSYPLTPAALPLPMDVFTEAITDLCDLSMSPLNYWAPNYYWVPNNYWEIISAQG